MPVLSDEQKTAFIRDGFLLMPDLLPLELVKATREGLLSVLQIDSQDAATWQGKHTPDNSEAIALTEACRTPEVEAVAEQLVGPGFTPGLSYSPYLESKGNPSPLSKGFIPVLNFPVAGPQEFVAPQHYHIDGMHLTTTWPGKFFLVVFAYLSDTAKYGGATTVLPGSHRQVFEHWIATDDKGNTAPPRLDYLEPVPVAGKAGDVIFMHYLMVHSGSTNRSSHIRVGLNTAVMPSSDEAYKPKVGPPQPDWTPLDWTLRTDNLDSKPV